VIWKQGDGGCATYGAQPPSPCFTLAGAVTGGVGSVGSAGVPGVSVASGVALPTGAVAAATIGSALIVKICAGVTSAQVIENVWDYEKEFMFYSSVS